MISVCTAIQGSEHVAEFRRWVEAEWGDVDSFFEQNGKVLPAPILALKDGTLVGGLSFTYSSIPGTKEAGLWINTLLVVPEFRRMGIGTRLIAAAESCVGLVGARELYAFTEVAEIYQKHGWRIHSNTGKSAVLRKAIPRA